MPEDIASDALGVAVLFTPPKATVRSANVVAALKLFDRLSRTTGSTYVVPIT